ncbi:MAG: hypothetical protein EBU97_04335, partial [Rhodobacteraceae bacterium]|nr:hypothetical protein [Paracoccaceae bacterium]
MCVVQMVRLRGFGLAPDANLMRSLPERLDALGADVSAEFDAATVFYAGWQTTAENRIALYGPPLRNLKAQIRQTRFLSGSRTLSLRSVRDHYKFSKTTLAGSVERGEVQFANPAFAGSLPVQHSMMGRAFAGKNVIYTMSKNNDLRWIVDWLTWHHKRHGANAFVIVDNQSSAYSADDLADALRSVSGYDQGMVILAPFPFGPRRQAAASLQYLQLAMHNMIFEQLLHRSRAVLFTDIDELVFANADLSIFDAACDSWLGVVGIAGRWMHQPLGTPARHGAHVLLRPDDAACAPKYCATPRGLARVFQPNVHGLRHIGRRRIADARF